MLVQYIGPPSRLLQHPIAQSDRDKTAFVPRAGCHRFTAMPFGLTGVLSVFQRLMDFVLCGLSYMTCLVYLDNIIIFGRSFDEQLARLREVFNRIRSANLKLKRTSALSFDGAFLSLDTLCPSTASRCNRRRSEQYGIGCRARR